VPVQELLLTLVEAVQELTFADDQDKETDAPFNTGKGPSEPFAFKSTDKFPLTFEVHDWLSSGSSLVVPQ